MAVSPTDAEALVAELVAVYGEAEATLLEVIAKHAAVNGPDAVDGPVWAQRKMAEIPKVRAELQRAIARHESRVLALLADFMDRAYRIGAAMAGKDIPPAPARKAQGALQAAGAVAPGSRALAALAAEHQQQVVGTHLRMLRASEDIYRRTVYEAAAQSLTGTVTRRDAAQKALTKLAARGVTGYTSTDKNGRTRNWDLTSYVEQATRSATAKAQTEGAIARWTERGHDLVIVSDAPEECEWCRPWEGKVLSLSGQPHPGVPVAGTLRQATSGKGLFHSNCRHSLSLYIHGVTKRPARPTADPQGDKDRQKLRRLERETRAAKRQLAAAATPEAKAAAQAKIRARQAQIREHVASTDVTRQPHRERLGAAR